MDWNVVIILWIANISICLSMKDNFMIGLQYKNFTSLNGTVNGGRCCDLTTWNVFQQGSCPQLDQCDVAFKPCGTLHGQPSCENFFKSWTPVTYNDNSFVIGERIGNGNVTSPSLSVYIYDFAPEDVHFSILIGEISDNFTTIDKISNLSFTIDWYEQKYNDPPVWHQLIERDSRAELGIDVFRQCYSGFYGPTCSIECRSTSNYTCLDDGSKNCTEGVQGPNCDEFVPYCQPGLCLNGGTCINILLGYRCSCPVTQSGPNCENVVTTLGPVGPTTSPSKASATTNWNWLTTSVISIPTTKASTYLPTSATEKQTSLSPLPPSLSLSSLSTSSATTQPSSQLSDPASSPTSTAAATASTKTTDVTPLISVPSTTPQAHRATTKHSFVTISPRVASGTSYITKVSVSVPADESTSDPTAIIAGCVTAGCLLLAASAGLCYYLMTRSKRKKNEIEATSDESNHEPPAYEDTVINKPPSPVPAWTSAPLTTTPPTSRPSSQT